MRLAWPPPRQLIGSFLIPIAALAMIHLAPSSLEGALSAIALVLVLFVPGYLAVLWAYPSKSDLSRAGRAALSLAASVILAGLAAVLLASTPRGLQSASLATLLSLLSLFLFVVAYLRWSGLPRNRRFLIFPRSGLRMGPHNPRKYHKGVSRRGAAYAALLLGIGLVAALSLSFGPDHNPLDDLYSLFGGPSSDQGAGQEDRLLTLSKGDQAQFDLPSNLSRLQVSAPVASGPAANNSTASDAISSPIPDNSSINSSSINSSRRLSVDNRRTAFFGGGGGGGETESSSAAAGSKASTRAKSSSPRAPQEVEDALVLEEVRAGGYNSTPGGNDSNHSLSAGPTGQILPGNFSGNQTGRDKVAYPGNGSSEIGAGGTALLSGPASSLPTPPAKNQSNASALAVGASLPPSGKPSAPSSVGDDSIKAQNMTAKAAEHGALAKDLIRSNASSPVNQPPVLEALIPDRPGPQPPGMSVFWRAKATDYEGDKIHYKFLLNGQEATKWSRIGSWSWPTAGLAAGDYQISVLVRDEYHASDSSFDDMINASFVLQPINRAPALKDLRSDRASPAARGGGITWTASATDPDNDTVYYKFLKEGQEASAWSISPSWIWNTSSESEGEYLVTVLARDGRHASGDFADSSLEQRFVLILPNLVPAISDLRSDRPSPQPQGSLIEWTAVALDPEGDPIYYRFLVDGAEAGEWASSSSWTWDTSAASPGGHVIKALVRDGKHAANSSFDGFRESAFNITPANRPPLLAALQPDPASPQAQGTTVTWKAEAADPEGDQIYYKFQLNGRDMTGWTDSPTWKWSSQGQSAGSYGFRVLVRDGRHAPEGSSDDYKDSIFTLISEIDQQIEKLQRKS